MKPRALFKSKTGVLNLLVAIVGALACFDDTTADTVKANAPAILTALGIAGIALRRFTKGRVTFFKEEPYSFNDGHGH